MKCVCRNWELMFLDKLQQENCLIIVQMISPEKLLYYNCSIWSKSHFAESIVKLREDFNKQIKKLIFVQLCWPPPPHPFLYYKFDKKRQKIGILPMILLFFISTLTNEVFWPPLPPLSLRNAIFFTHFIKVFPKALIKILLFICICL